ncbi:MAG: di-heme oxidoredictase family protein [Planctomycetota bacterium]
MSSQVPSQTVGNRSQVAALLAAALVLVSSVTSAQQPPTGPPPPPPPGFGLPLPGLTGAQLAAFEDGRDDFTEVEDKAGGLGPIFNRDSCVACHGVPAIGGSSRVFVTRFGRAANGVFDPLASLGGSLLQERAIDPSGLEHVPREANVVARRQSTPLFGLGLIEAIPDATILRGVRTKPVDGVLGKASMVVDAATKRTLVGRFGWKGQQATLLSFAGDAYLNEMGVTNRLFPTENAPNGNVALLKRLDTVKDPEDQPDPDTGKAGIDLLADFMRFLGPPPTQPVTASNTFGAKLFLDVGCTSCHTPVMFTGPSTTAALNAKAVMLYSDLLLHDMGTLGDGIVQGSAGVREMKTPPLWGLRASGPYLHDGRANTIEDAIKAHDGEAKVSKDRFQKLTRDQQALLVEFLKSI